MSLQPCGLIPTKLGVTGLLLMSVLYILELESVLGLNQSLSMINTWEPLLVSAANKYFALAVWCILL